MKVLVTGANGFLGQHLCAFLSAKYFNVLAVGRGEQLIQANKNLEYTRMDITDEWSLQQFMKKHQPDIIIHAAAMSKPDECEKNKALCLQVNVEGTKNLLNYPAAQFIYISSDFIYGDNGPHAEDDPAEPLNFYGESKLNAEQLVKNSGLNFAIVRPVLIYGQAGIGTKPTFLHWVKQSLEAKKPIKVVSDQVRTPTYVIDICKAIETIIVENKQGIFNIGGKDFITPYDMATITAKVLELDESLIEKVDSNTFKEPVKRAKLGGVKIDKARKELNYAPIDFVEGVRLSFEL